MKTSPVRLAPYTLWAEVPTRDKCLAKESPLALPSPAFPLMHMTAMSVHRSKPETSCSNLPRSHVSNVHIRIKCHRETANWQPLLFVAISTSHSVAYTIPEAIYAPRYETGPAYSIWHKTSLSGVCLGPGFFELSVYALDWEPA